MSYSIEVIIDEEGVKLGTMSGLEHLPKGKLVINGHVPSKDTSPVASLSVAQYGPPDPEKHGMSEYIASVSTAYPGVKTDG